jgi:DNA modification methylase
LRDYGTASWDGGEAGHEHVGLELRTADTGGPKQQTKRGSIGVRSGDCACGAVRQDHQLGLEPTPEEYVANMVAVFREVRRVLRQDGTCWLNLGDSYIARQQGWGLSNDRSWAAYHKETGDSRERSERVGRGEASGSHEMTRRTGLAPKQLVGIPWRVAFALQADGWYLRSDIIWSKPNPMPESVTDRPTKSHEYLFLLSKRPTYYYDQEAIRQPNAAHTENVAANGWVRQSQTKVDASRNDAPTQAAGQPAAWHNPAGRNRRSVWTIATKPYPGAHFAVFPPELVEPCVKAGTSERGVCPECGAPWRRVVERVASEPQRENYHGQGIVPRHRGGVERVGGYYPETPATTGWQPSCAHDAEPVPSVVLDPFAGSGTVGMVAQRLSRRAILVDLNPDYLEQQFKRNVDMPLGLVG